MKKQTRKTLQVFLVVALAAAAVRVGVIFYQRKHANAPRQQQEHLMNADYYVTPKKLHAYDLVSARELTKQPVWVREGYRYSFFSYDPARRQADLRHPVGMLGPIERIKVTDVIAQRTSDGPSQVLAVFEREAGKFAVPIGTEQKGDFNIYADEIFYIQDPRDLYKHWSADVWRSIEQHEVKPGMNEIQAAFAVGMGTPHPMNGEEKTVDYPNGGSPLRITYRNGRAVEIAPKPQG